jgi:molybdopterin/thiamine biosynthesis adenylyltransferase
MCARELGTRRTIRVVSLGQRRLIQFPKESRQDGIAETFDRQVRAFGRDGQFVLQSLTIGIVGLGGTGSIIAQQLAHLGVRQFVLVDPDVIEVTNLNRIVAATKNDVGSLKVDVAAKNITEISGNSNIRVVDGNIVQTRIARALIDTDLIFGCTDSHGSRAILQQIAYQYLIPCVDMGSTIIAAGEAIKGIFGRVQMLSPTLPCFTCSELLNAEEVRRDMMSDYERRLDPYIQGAYEPAPSVISINGTVASLAVTMFMAYTTGIPSKARYLMYNATAGTMRSVSGSPQDNCYICSKKGAYARGNSLPLYGRMD